jgi:hypothetical protein
MIRERHAVTAALAACGLLLAGGGAVSDAPKAGPSSPGAAIEEMEARGLGAIASAEIERAKALLAALEDARAQGSEHADAWSSLLEMQIGLLAQMEKASAALKEAQSAEMKSQEALEAMKGERAAYDYFVDQILASGLVSQWAVP